MNKLILENRSYVIWDADYPTIENHLKKIGERIGFRLIKVKPHEKLEEIIVKVKKPIALFSNRLGLDLTSPHFSNFKDRYFKLHAQGDISNAVPWLHKKMIEPIPSKLIQLVENAIQDIAPRMLGTEPGLFSKSDDFERVFSNLITCDSSAHHFSAKASCEVDFAKIRTEYTSFKKMTDQQLVDLFCEICNQALGSMNFRLRSIGLDPRISLPIGVELRAADSVTQVDYMPMIKLIDKKRTTSICIAVKVEPQCSAKWDELEVTATDGEVDFF